MRPNSLISYDGYGVHQSAMFDPSDDTSLYAPTPGNFHRSPASPSDISCINVDVASPSIAPLHNKLLRKRIIFHYSNLVTGRKAGYMTRTPRSVYTT
jgi:hypothetical protein